ncbi:MAG: glycoside hydrolase family 9 protein, partial [Spirochaeta sp.]
EDGRQEYGAFPRQPSGPVVPDPDGRYELAPLASGSRLTVAPESDERRLSITALETADVHTAGPAAPGPESARLYEPKLQLLDGRVRHTNGWFIVRSPLPVDQTGEVLRWRVSPSVLPDYLSPPVIQINQIGYHPASPKRALMEIDEHAPGDNFAWTTPLELVRIETDGSQSVAASGGTDAGACLRYRYRELDFTAINRPGLYRVRCGTVSSAMFRINESIFERHVWQPVLEYLLPVQMCHMRVEDGYRVWHGRCHCDDAIMAPTDHNHFDGYLQGPQTLCRYNSGDPVPGLNRGGWHDAGDFDLRLESQSDTVYGLALAWELFRPEYDITTIDQEQGVVRLHTPDGTPDILQQIEHGLLSILGAWKSMGRLYRGIIEADLEDYVLLGDPVNHRRTRLVFTEHNPGRELDAAAALACASRALHWHRPALAAQAADCAQAIWLRYAEAGEPYDELTMQLLLTAAAELALASDAADALIDEQTGKKACEFVLKHPQECAAGFDQNGGLLLRLLPLFKEQTFDTELIRDWKATMHTAARQYKTRRDNGMSENPYGVPYHPRYWGSGWPIQRFGVRQYLLHRALPEVFDNRTVLNAFNFILGCHPGQNRSSFVSGVGTESVCTAYGLNRADWSYIPGGSVSGTACIGPDFPELLEWPYLWQQTEYVLGGGTTDWLVLALAVRDMFC